MKHIFLFTIFTLLVHFSQAQCVADSAEVYKKYTKKELQEDLAFLAAKIENVHANPFASRSKASFKKEVTTIKSKLKDGLTKKDFYLLVAPLIGKLDDEHASLNDYCITEKEKKNSKVFPLGFKYVKGKAILVENYTEDISLKIGDELIEVNDVPIQEIITKCNEFSRGNKSDREKQAINHLGIFLNKFCFQWKDSYDFSFASGTKSRISDVSWEVYQKKKEEFQKKRNTKEISFDNKDKFIQYQLINGNGYLKIVSFHVGKSRIMKMWEDEIKSIFIQIQQDKPQQLFIDVSQNGGGNSAIGDILIDYFSDKPIKSYSGTWRRSKEYLDFLNKLGIKNEEYNNIKLGKNYIMSSYYTQPSDNTLRFLGKTYILIGNQTFSSAIMFAVTAQDNKIATLIGESPENGHANHTGEMISFTMPNTKLSFQFGVKKWVRPSGDTKARELIPDIQLDIENMTIAEIMKKVGG